MSEEGAIGSWSRVIPLVILDQPTRAAGLAEVLRSTGLHIVEVGLRTPAALQVVRELARSDDLTVLAGTVLNRSQALDAISAGAAGLISPGFVPDVADAAAQADLPYVPGIATPTEALAAHAAGTRHVKFFPADRLGGLKTLRAIAAAITDLQFMPSGGVTGESAAAYLAAAEVFAVSGTWMTPRALLEDGEWDEIHRLLAASSGLWTGDV